MKISFLVLLIVASAPALVIAQPSHQPKSKAEKICESLQDDLNEKCDHLMCDDLIADGTFKDMNDCTTASDYGEAAQATCEELPTLEDAVKEFNQTHPKAKLACD